MRILITGANGFLGNYLIAQLLAKNYQVMATGKGECRLNFADENNFQYEPMDFTDPFAVHDVFEKYKPEIVIHAGAMTSADKCEQEQWLAFTTNVQGTLTMLFNAEDQKSFFIFISTDFVFDGKKGVYMEDDSTNPVNYYGKTKTEAEEAVHEYSYDWAIIRTSLVYGRAIAGKKNLLTVVKEKLEKGEEYAVVNDQVRTPTYVDDLAFGIVAIIEKKVTGIFHLSGEDILTPYTMAVMLAEYLMLDTSLLHKVTAANFSQPAKRPVNTSLVIDKAKRTIDFHPRSFGEGLINTFGN